MTRSTPAAATIRSSATLGVDVVTTIALVTLCARSDARQAGRCGDTPWAGTMKLCGDTLVDDGQLVVRQVVAQPPGVAGEVRQLAQPPARRTDQPLALEAGPGDELAMRGVVLETSAAGHHEHHACDAALVRGSEQSARGAPGIVEVLEHVAAEKRLEAPGCDAGQIRGIGLRR